MATRALATAFVNIVPGTSDLESYLKGKLSSDVASAGQPAGKALAKGVGKGFGGSIKGFLAPAIGSMTASFGVLGAINFFGNAISQSSDLNESINAVNVTYGENAKGILALGENAARAVGLSKNEFNGLATQFSAFAGTIAGKGGDVVGVINDLTTRGADFASVMNIDVNDAMGLFQSGLAGETEPLRRYGIDLSAAKVQQYALAQGMIHGKEQMTEAQKVQARYGLLMEQTNKTAGDFANTSDQLANKQRITNAQLKDAQALLGDRLRPVMLALTNIASAVLVPAIQGIGVAFDWFNANQGWLLPLLAGIGTAMLGIAINTIAMNTAAAIAAAGGLPAVIAATWAWTAALLANPVTWIVLGISLLIAGLVALAMNWDAVTKWITENMGWLADTFGWLWNNILAPIFNFIGAAVGVLATVFGWLWNTILAPIFNVFGTVLGWLWNTIISPIFNFIMGIVSAVGAAWENTFGGMIKYLTDNWASIMKIIAPPINGVIDLLNSMIDGLNSIKVDIPDWVPLIGGQVWQLNIPRIPKLAKGGFVDQPTTALIGEAGPEVVTPLADFKQMMGLDQPQADQPIMADGMGLIGWMRREANGQATIVFNTELGKTRLGAR